MGALLLTAALAAARAGDEPAAWRVLGEARSVASMFGADHADIYAIFGPTNVAIHEVQVAVEVGDAAGATRRGQCLRVEQLPESLVERRAQLLIDLARAPAQLGQPSVSLATLLQAERTAPQEVRMSSDASRTVASLLMTTRTPAPALRALADRLGYGVSTSG